MKRISIRKIDEMISLLESIERVDGNSENYKNLAVAYLKNYADAIEDKGMKTVRIRGSEDEQGKREVVARDGKTER